MAHREKDKSRKRALHEGEARKRAEHGGEAKPIFGQRATLIAVLIIVGVALVFFNQIVFKGEILTGGDVLAGAAIFRDYGNEQIGQGTYPFWNPYIFAGMPYYSSMTYNAYIYPSHWIMWLFDKITAGNTPPLMFLFLHYLLAGLGMLFFLRSRGVGHGGAVVGGLAFMLTPHLIGLAAIGHGGKILTAAYIPLILMAVQKLFETGRWWWLGLLSLFGGLQFLARHIQVSYYTWLMVGLFFLFYLATRDRSAESGGLVIRKTGMLVGALVLALALGAVLLLPVHEYSEYSTRTALEGGMGFSQATMWSMHPKELATFLVPSLFGLEGETYWGTMPFQQVSYYVGYVVLCLAALSLVRARDKTVRFLLVLLAVSLIFSFGRHIGPVYKLLYSILPGFKSFRVPALFLIFSQFAITALAGFGASLLLGEREHKGVAWIRWAIGAAAVGIIVGLISLASRDGIVQAATSALFSKHAGVPGAWVREVATRAAALATRDAGILIAFAAAAGVTILAVSRRKLPGWIAAALVMGVVVWDVSVMDFRFLRPEKMLPLSSYYPETPAVQYLKQQDGVFRVAPLGRDFTSNAWMYHRIQSIGGYHPAKLAIYDDLLKEVGVGDLRLLSLLNVKYLVGPESLEHEAFVQVAPGVYENRFVLPRAFLVGSAKKIASARLMLRELSIDSFDPFVYATVLEDLPGPVESTEGSVAELLSYKPQEIVVRATAERPCLLVFSEVYYPAGWKALIDGNETEIYRTDYAFRSVYLEQGEHTVTMKYAPFTVRLGLIVTLLAAVAVALLLLLPGLRRTEGAGQ